MEFLLLASSSIIIHTWKTWNLFLNDFQHIHHTFLIMLTVPKMKNYDIARQMSCLSMNSCLILSPPSAECFSFFCSSSPLPYLEICSCPFFFHFKQVLVGSFRQRSCHTFLFPANLKSLFCNFETPFRRFFGLGVHLSWHRAAHLGCLAQSSSSWSKLPSVTRVAQRSFNKLLPSQQDWAKVLQNCAAGFWDPGRRVWEQTASTPPHRPTQTCLLPAHIWQFWHIFRFTAAIQWD